MTQIRTSFLIQLLVPVLSCSLVFAQEEMLTKQESTLEEEVVFDEYSGLQQESRPQEITQLDTAQQEESSHRDAPTPPLRASQEPRHPVFSQQELDQILAPIALYPDQLLSQILMAATYPLEVIEAARWSKANPNLKGEQAVQSVAEYPWDPSVKSLDAFPQVLMTMDEKLNWMEQLGDAFLTQEQQVLDTVQQLRQKAHTAGNLSSNERVTVEQQGQSIIIQPTNPQVVYVPYYNPLEVYGPWWWPAYRPVYWGLWPGYFYGPRFGAGFAWGFGIGIGPRFFFGGFNWPFRHVTVSNVNNFYFRPRFGNGATGWVHNPVHRRGIPYHNSALRHRFGRTSAFLGSHAFRGQAAPSVGGHSGVRHRGLTGRRFTNRSDFQGGASRFDSARSSRPRLHSFSNRPNFQGGLKPRIGSRPPAFARGRQADRLPHFGSGGGHAKAPGFAAPRRGGFRGGGGFHGGGGSRGGRGRR